MGPAIRSLYLIKQAIARDRVDGLQLGVPYSYAIAGYPTGNNDGTGGSVFSWQPADAVLRNLTGVANGDGTVTIYTITSTISGNGHQGADPNQLIKIMDNLTKGRLEWPLSLSLVGLSRA